MHDELTRVLHVVAHVLRNSTRICIGRVLCKVRIYGSVATVHCQTSSILLLNQPVAYVLAYTPMLYADGKLGQTEKFQGWFHNLS
jgi:hypothetical protein